MNDFKQIPNWIKYVVFGLVVALLIVFYFLWREWNTNSIDKAKVVKKEIVSQIDSLKVKSNEIIKVAENDLTEKIIKSREKIKTIENEKLYFVTDTLYLAKCDFIAEFQPTKR